MDFFSRFSTCGFPKCFAGVLCPSGKTDFATVGSHLLCSTGQYDRCLRIGIYSYQDRGVSFGGRGASPLIPRYARREMPFQYVQINSRVR